VLLVDDEEVVRESTRRLLEHLGYQPLVAADGVAALELYRAHRDRIRAVVLDVMMPGMGGEEVYAELRQLEPAIRVLVVSGFPGEGACARLAEAGATGFLAKPFHLQELADALAAVIG
jgi:CheY-like chemotaxis protein